MQRDWPTGKRRGRSPAPQISHFKTNGTEKKGQRERPGGGVHRATLVRLARPVSSSVEIQALAANGRARNEDRARPADQSAKEPKSAPWATMPPRRATTAFRAAASPVASEYGHPIIPKPRPCRRSPTMIASRWIRKRGSSESRVCSKNNKEKIFKWKKIYFVEKSQ